MNVQRQCLDELFKSILTSFDLTHHHIDSYNLCVSKWIKDIIYAYGDISTIYDHKKYSTILHNYKFVRQNILPSDAHKYRKMLLWFSPKEPVSPHQYHPGQ